MEYIYYILVTLVIGALCLALVRRSDQSRSIDEQARLAEKARRRRLKSKAVDDSKSIPNSPAVLQRELSQVPTPWGWPGHNGTSGDPTPSRQHALQESTGVSKSLHRWVDRMVSEKRTVEDREYVIRKDASLRAMLEDRYGRASQMSEIEYRKIKAPLLRDPGQPHDQMDNFPSGRTQEIASKISNRATDLDIQEQSKSAFELKEVKTPWGW